MLGIATVRDVTGGGFVRVTTKPFQTGIASFDHVILSGYFTASGANYETYINGLVSSSDPQCGSRGCIRSQPIIDRAIFLGQEGNGSNPLSNDIAEVIVYGNVTLDDARRTLIENYLSAKYAIQINPPADFYAGDTEANGDYDFDVTGIGVEADSSVTTSASSAGLRLTALNETLDEGEYVLAGHSHRDEGIEVVDVSLTDGVIARFNRIWYLDDNDGAVDLALTFDFGDAGLPNGPYSDDRYRLLYSATNDPANLAPVAATVRSQGDRVIVEADDADLLSGYYTLGSTDASMVDPTVATPSEPMPEVPEGYALSAVYPNPFNPQATFTLALLQAQDVTVAVYDILGQRVATLHEGGLAAQEHRFTLNAAGWPSGLYLVRAVGEQFVTTQRAVLLK